MPIDPIVLQRRMAEIGRIRIGNQQPTGNGRTRPNKLTKFRFTSPHRRHIDDLAALYGGTVQPWAVGTRTEWEVYTEAASVPVIVVRGGVTQWLEHWTGGGCARRCDGKREVLSDSPCLCDTEGGERTCKPTTRLAVMLRELQAIGVWRLESHGWNAAAELPNMAELAAHLGDLVPARLVLAERVSVRDGKTSRYVVPGLDLEVTPTHLAAVVSGLPVAGQPAAPAVESAPIRVALSATPEAPPAPPAPDFLAMVSACVTREELSALWRAAGKAGALTDDLKEAMHARAAALPHPDPWTTRPETEPPPPEPEREHERAPVAAAAPAGDMLPEDVLWREILTTAGHLGWTEPQVRNAYAQNSGGQLVEDADAQQLADFLDMMRGAQQ